MVILGVDAHKRSHTVVVADETGRRLASKTVGTTTAAHLTLLRWAAAHGAQRRWAIEDCRHLSRRLERDLLTAGETVVRVPPKLMAHARDSARGYGKSDPIDALAVARAALREPDLPTAVLDGEEREVRLLVDHREDLVAERVRILNRLRWNLHELDPGYTPPARLDRPSAYDAIEAHLGERDGTLARLSRTLTDHARRLSTEITALTTEITELIQRLAPTLLTLPGCAGLTAAKIVAETANITRFHSRDAFARHNGTAPVPVWSGNRARHRLSRTGNRQLNAALHRIALTQARCHPAAQHLLTRRKTAGNRGMEALRILKRHISDAVYQALLTDTPTP